MKRILLSSSAVALALLLTGCYSPVPQVLTPADVPSNFTAPVTADAQIWPQKDWWKGFGSEELDGLIDDARKNNLDLAVAIGQVLQAKGNSEIAGSALFPQISLGGSAQRQSIAKSQRGSETITTGSPPVTTTLTEPGISNSFGLNVDASYEVDLWGEAINHLTAADEQVKSSQYAKQVVALTITANVGTTYLDVLALRERVAIAKQNIDAASRILTITQAKVTNGVSSRLDLAQQEAQLDGQEAQVPPLEEAEREARYALAILLARLPEGFDVKGQNLDKIVSPSVKPGLPSELLRRRPDVAEAEANLAAAHANVDAARAAFFPQIGLSGSGGVASAAIGSLIKSSNFAWTIGASLLQTIFDGGNLEGQLRVTKAEQIQLIATYRKAVLSAFSDVETSLGQVSSLSEQEKHLTDEVNAASEAFRISELQYREGVTDLLTVLTAQQTLFTAQDELVQIKLARIQADIGLYKALGGGWSEADVKATQTIPASATQVAPSSVSGPEAAPATPVPTTPGPQQIPDDTPPPPPSTAPHH